MTTEARPGKIMVVDDEASVRRAIKKGLTKAGYECIEVDDPLIVLARLQNAEPDAVILDIMMPGKSGRELLAEIKTWHPKVSVIMSTAVIDPKVIIECMRSGAQDYITKPFDMEEIIQSVSKALGMQRLEDEINQYYIQLEKAVDDQKQKIRDLFLNSIEALVHALEAKDQYTAGHSRRVTKYALTIGQNMALTADYLDDLHWGALLHDVGKISIDPAIQNKPGRLSSDEYRYMMTHAMIGAGIVKPLASPEMIDIIVHHHDYYDGSGDGHGLKGEAIPLGARIVAVADSFDAMTSDRPYRKALTFETGFEELKRCSGKQFDPAVVTAFLKAPSAEWALSTTKEMIHSRTAD